MSRVAGVQNDKAGLRTRIIFWLAKWRMGRVSRGFRVRAYDPKLILPSVRMDNHTAAAVTVPLILKELAQVKVAAMVGCPF